MSRAVNPLEKELRREALLDAAEEIWLSGSERAFCVEGIARAAGVAKGTLYLYFRSKEELLLALHGRHTSIFFDHLIDAARRSDCLTIQDLNALVLAFFEDCPAFLPLASLCHGFIDRQIPLEVAFEFKQGVNAHLNLTVDALKPHFRFVSQALMLQSYSLILGLWQLARPTELKQLMIERDLGSACGDDYRVLLQSALSRLWAGAMMETLQ